MGFCFKCQTEFRGKPARGDDCEKCRASLRCCMNCKHYDPKAYNGCNEPQAERVVEKDRGNFCDYFSANELKGPGDLGSAKNTLKKLDDLFK